jgi:Cyclic nucleotide-binding domain
MRAIPWYGDGLPWPYPSIERNLTPCTSCYARRPRSHRPAHEGGSGRRSSQRQDPWPTRRHRPQDSSSSPPTARQRVELPSDRRQAQRRARANSPRRRTVAREHSQAAERLARCARRRREPRQWLSASAGLCALALAWVWRRDGSIAERSPDQACRPPVTEETVAGYPLGNAPAHLQVKRLSGLARAGARCGRAVAPFVGPAPPGRSDRMFIYPVTQGHPPGWVHLHPAAPPPFTSALCCALSLSVAGGIVCSSCFSTFPCSPRSRRPVLEQLASALAPARFATGSTVFSQGDRGDRFYVIAEGEIAIAVDGRPAPLLGPGDSFGEIALLRDTPRTATATVRSDAPVYTPERDEFLAAVTGHPPSPRPPTRSSPPASAPSDPGSDLYDARESHWGVSSGSTQATSAFSSSSCPRCVPYVVIGILMPVEQPGDELGPPTLACCDEQGFGLSTAAVASARSLVRMTAVRFAGDCQ